MMMVMYDDGDEHLLDKSIEAQRNDIGDCIESILLMITMGFGVIVCIKYLSPKR